MIPTCMLFLFSDLNLNDVQRYEGNQLNVTCHENMKPTRL